MGTITQFIIKVQDVHTNFSKLYVDLKSVQFIISGIDQSILTDSQVSEINYYLDQLDNLAKSIAVQASQLFTDLPSKVSNNDSYL